VSVDESFIIKNLMNDFMTKSSVQLVLLLSLVLLLFIERGAITLGEVQSSEQVIEMVINRYDVGTNKGQHRGIHEISIRKEWVLCDVIDEWYRL
jgi:hypothetical protein